MRPFKIKITVTTIIHFNELTWKNYIRNYSPFKLHNGELLTFLLTLNCMREVTEGRGSVRLGRGWRSVESLTLRDILRQSGPWPLCSSSFDILTPTWGHWDGKDSHTTRKFCWALTAVYTACPRYKNTRFCKYRKCQIKPKYWCNIRQFSLIRKKFVTIYIYTEVTVV
jgi:hypothetical protein